MVRHNLIGGTPVRLITDHQLLLYLMSLEGLKGQYALFALVLQEYSFNIEHQPGIKHQMQSHCRVTQLPAPPTTQEAACTRRRAPMHWNCPLRR